jgi:hypothetical protein
MRIAKEAYYRVSAQTDCFPPRGRLEFHTFGTVVVVVHMGRVTGLGAEGSHHVIHSRAR